MAWRKITADCYRLGTDAEGFDEAFVRYPGGGRREIWDVAADLDKDGNVVLWTAAAEPTRVRPESLIEVR